MATLRAKMYVCRRPGGELDLCATDMSHIGWPLVKTQIVEIDVPEPSRSEIIEAEIRTLSIQSEKLMSEAIEQENEIQRKIDALKGGLND